MKWLFTMAILKNSNIRSKAELHISLLLHMCQKSLRCCKEILAWTHMGLTGMKQWSINFSEALNASWLHCYEFLQCLIALSPLLFFRESLFNASSQILFYRKSSLNTLSPLFSKVILPASGCEDCADVDVICCVNRVWLPQCTRCPAEETELRLYLAADSSARLRD
jgi:hypothetical protein